MQHSIKVKNIDGPLEIFQLPSVWILAFRKVHALAVSTVRDSRKTSGVKKVHYKSNFTGKTKGLRLDASCCISKTWSNPVWIVCELCEV